MKQRFHEVLQNYKKLFKEALTDLKTKGRRHRQIPNMLTLTRLIAAPLFIIPAAVAGNIPLIVGFTAIFSLTDALDGFIARKWNLTSELGKDLDAICDKVFAGTLLLGASAFNPMLLINLVFEAVIAIINVKGKLETQSPRSLYVGKIKTCVLYPLLGAGFLNHFIDISLIFVTLFISTVTMQMLTVASYLLKYDHDKKGKMENKKVIEDVTISEETGEEKEKTLGKELEQGDKKASISRISEYREMRDLLMHEAEINYPSCQEEQKGHEKKLK